MIDYRTRVGREAEVLAQIEIDNGLSVAWVDEIAGRRTALRRLIASGTLRHLPCKHPSFLRLEFVRVRPEGLVKRLVGRLFS